MIGSVMATTASRAHRPDAAATRRATGKFKRGSRFTVTMRLSAKEFAYSDRAARPTAPTRASLVHKRLDKGRNMAEELQAPLAGTILSVLVAPGAKIDRGDELLVIEAMKMENMVYAPCAGAISAIMVKAGDRVDAGDLLLVIE
jgi:biotin carboxyl carrier protein